MKKNNNCISVLLICMLFMVSCNKREKTQQSSEASSVSSQAKVPSNFNADSAYQFIAKQLSFGKRVPNTAPHVLTKDYLVSKLESYGWGTTVQSFESKAFDGKNLRLFNIIASFNPDAKKRILLCSHWDSRPFADMAETLEQKKTPIDGANDGASGVGVLIEIARLVSQAEPKPTVGIDIIFFDGEDYGQPDFLGGEQKKDSWCLGSQYWANNPHKPNYQAFFGVLLDMVGAKNAKFALDGTTRYYAPGVQKKIWDLANSLGFNNYFIYTQSDEIIDDHYYINKIAKIPTVDIIDYDPSDGIYFGNYWHTHQDNLESIDKNTLHAVGTTLIHLIYSE